MMQDFEMVMALGYRITWFGHHGNPHHHYSHCTRMYIPSGQKRPIKPARYHGMIHMWSAPFQPPLLSVVLNLVPELVRMAYSTISRHVWHHITATLSLHPPLLPSAHHYMHERAVRQRWWWQMMMIASTCTAKWQNKVPRKLAQYHWPPFNPSKPG